MRGSGLSMSQQALKEAVAREALKQVGPGQMLGLGSGSTVNAFIAELGASGLRIEGAVAASEETERRLREAGIAVFDLNAVGRLSLYVDGADEIDGSLQMIKGGGGALAREKVIASASERFVCIADASKLVKELGRFPLPIEVLPLARRLVADRVVRLGGMPSLRPNYRTDNGNLILDVKGLSLAEPAAVEATLNQIAGVVAVGIFAARPADVLLLAKASGEVQLYKRP